GCYGEPLHLAALIELVQGLAEELAVRQLLLSDRRERQQRHGAQAAAEERKQADAHLVGPVQVLQDDNQRPLSGEAHEDLANRLEDVTCIPATAERKELRRQRCSRKLGEKASELGPPSRLQGGEELLLQHDLPRSERVDPGPQ